MYIVINILKFVRLLLLFFFFLIKLGKGVQVIKKLKNGELLYTRPKHKNNSASRRNKIGNGSNK
jgi:hypothetical protein